LRRESGGGDDSGDQAGISDGVDARRVVRPAGARWRRWVWEGAAVVVGAMLAVVGVPLGAYESAACAWLGIGCAPGEPGGGLPEVRRLTAAEVATGGAYIALGDSYSSGEGAYADGEPPVNDGAEACRRSRSSYVPMVTESHEFAAGVEFWACSGATTREVLRSRRGQDPQVDRVGPVTGLVTISLGGNDAGFTHVLRQCILRLPWSDACLEQEAAVRERLARLGPDLRRVLTEIRARAPQARVIVLGYPRPFPRDPAGMVDNLRVEDQRWLNGMTRLLNDTIAGVVAEADKTITAFGGSGSVEFVDAYEAFAGHEVGTARPFLNGLDVDLGEFRVLSRSFHPTPEGYRRFGELINRQIADGPDRPLNNFQISGG
jgi:lysophospholipase L1-like esterase